MVFLYAQKKILRGTELIDPKVEPVFEANADVAKQLDSLKSARPATKSEIDAFKARKDRADGVVFEAPAPSDAVVANSEPAPSSGNANDPQTAPKGKAT